MLRKRLRRRNKLKAGQKLCLSENIPYDARLASEHLDQITAELEQERNNVIQLKKKLKNSKQS